MSRRGVRGPTTSGLPPLPSPACRAHGVRMDSLSMLDAGFLEAEDSDRHISIAIGSVSVLEGPIPDDDTFVSGLAERVLAVPRFRQVLRMHPLDLEAPEWADAENFDIAHHEHRVALPHPGDDVALFRLTADVMEHRLDRERPLWECWIVEGLPDNQWAMIMKLHHCIADGIATMHMLAGLSDSGEGDTYATAIRAAKEPVQRGFWLPQLSADPRQWVGSMWHTSTALVDGARRALGGTVEILGGLLRPSPTSLVGPVTAMRRYAAAEVSLHEVARVCRAFDVTLNDVALAAITDAFRAVLIGRGEKPQRNSLRTLVPVSVRSNDHIGKVDNRVSLMLPYLPVEKSDPEDQLRTVHSRMTRAKGSAHFRLGGEHHSLPVDGVGRSRGHPAAPTRRRHGGDERTRPATDDADHGAKGGAHVPGSADRPRASDGNRDRELRRQARLRHHRRLRHRPGHRRHRLRYRTSSGTSRSATHAGLTTLTGKRLS